MKPKVNAFELADRIVRLMSQKHLNAMQEAVRILRSVYPNEPDQVIRGYELAALVVMRRALAEGKSKRNELISEQSDWLTIRALEASIKGDLHEAFNLIRIASDSGARPVLCRKAAMGILRQISNSDRISILLYNYNKVRQLEVGRLRDSGFLLISDFKAGSRQRPWQTSDLPQLDPGQLLIRSETEFKDDIEAGLVPYRRVGQSPMALRHIDWEAYLAAVIRKQSLALTHSKAA